MFDFSNPTTQAMWGGVIRSLLVAFGGGLGLSGNQAGQISGAVVVLLGIGWSLWSKKSAAIQANTTLAVAVQAVQNSSAPPIQAAAAVVAAHAANPGDVSAMRTAARTGTF